MNFLPHHLQRRSGSFVEVQEEDQPTVFYPGSFNDQYIAQSLYATEMGAYGPPLTLRNSHNSTPSD